MLQIYAGIVTAFCGVLLAAIAYMYGKIQALKFGTPCPVCKNVHGSDSVPLFCQIVLRNNENSRSIQQMEETWRKQWSQE